MSGPYSTIVVVKLSGSLFFSDQFASFVKSTKKILRTRRGLKLVFVAGGGPEARRYIEAARKLGADQATQDEIGIVVSRLNAKVFSIALGEHAFPSVPTTLSEVVSAVELCDSRAVTLGGLHPGQSTNAVAALVAEKLRASHFYNLTDVDGVYTEDPRKSRDAKKLDSVSVAELSQILGEESMSAGGYDLMDPVALKLIQRSNVPTTIMKCSASLLESALIGSGARRKGALGTRIITDSVAESE